MADTITLASTDYVDAELTTKQDVLVAGTGISIAADGKTISATGGGSGGDCEVFVATYNVTPLADVEAAVTAGKAVICKGIPFTSSETCSALLTLDYTGQYYRFYSQVRSNYMVYASLKKSNGEWSRSWYQYFTKSDIGDTVLQCRATFTDGTTQEFNVTANGNSNS